MADLNQDLKTKRFTINMITKTKIQNLSQGRIQFYKKAKSISRKKNNTIYQVKRILIIFLKILSIETF